MPLMIRPSLLHCDLGDVVVLLDLLSGRYRLLSGAAADAMRALLRDDATASQAKWLLESNLAVEQHECSRSFEPDVTMPTASIDDYAQSPISPLMIARAAFAQRRAARALGVHSFHEVLAALKAKAPATGSGSDRTIALALAFRKSWRWIGQAEQCLPRSVALVSMLFEQGEAARLVIGVEMPFAAHCWVQSGPLLLTEPLERIRPYTPILAV